MNPNSGVHSSMFDMTKLPQVFVANLPYSTNQKNFESMFYPYGSVVNAYLIPQRSGRGHRGFGFVCFWDDNSADEAVRHLNNAVIGAEKRRIEVDYTKAFKNRRRNLVNRAKMAEQLPAHVQRYPVINGFNGSHMVYYRAYPIPPMMNPQMMRRISPSCPPLRPALQSNQRTLNSNKSCKPQIFVSNVDYTCNHEILASLFSKFGVVEEAYLIPHHQTNSHKGFGFVSFKEDVAAEVAKDALQSFEFKGRKIIVDFSKKYKAFKKNVK